MEQTKLRTLDAIDMYYDRPDWFAEDMCDFIPDDWQREVMLDVANNPRVTVRSGQGVGKTGVEAVLTLWYLVTRPFPRVVATAPTQNQLYDVLWAEINKWLRDSRIKDMLKWTKTKVYMRGYEGVWFATAKTAAKPENMQGYHEDHMLFIVDEASGVQDNILEAIMGTLSGKENKVALFGNPTKLSGFFFDTHNSNRADWIVRKVSSRDSQRTSDDNIRMLERRYGEDSDVVRVRVDGEFPRNQSNGLINLAAAEEATQSNVDIRQERTLHIGADIARFGDDKTVIAARIGGRVFPLYKYTKKSTMETAGNIIRIAKAMKKQYGQISAVAITVDDDGLGGGVTDRLREINREEGLGYRVYGARNGGKPKDRSRYSNWITEKWDEMSIRLEANMSARARGEEDLTQLPKDEELISDLTSRRYYVNSNGRIEIEKKEEMKKRIHRSPDCADAVVLSYNTLDNEITLRGGKVY